MAAKLISDVPYTLAPLAFSAGLYWTAGVYVCSRSMSLYVYVFSWSLSMQMFIFKFYMLFLCIYATE